MQPHKTDHFQLAITGFFNILVLTVPLFFTLNTEELFEFNKMVLTYFITIIIVALWVARMVLHKSFIFRPTKLDIPILLFVLSQLLSTLFSIHPYTSLLGYYTRFHGGLLSTFSYVALYYAFVSNIELKQLKGFFLTLFGSASIVSIYAILEHFGHSTSCFLASQGQIFDTSCWIQDVKNRVFATFGQPNWLAAYLITLIPLGLFLTYAAQKTYTKWFGIIATALLFMALIFTRSRSGILGLGVGLVVFAALFFYIAWDKDHFKTVKTYSRSWILWVLFGVFASITLIFGTPFTPDYTSFIQTPQSPPTTTAPEVSAPAPVNRLDIGGTDSGDIRKIVWEGALQVWKRYPILGSGVETFAYSYYQDRPQEHNLVSEWDFLYNKAHNEFLNYLATTGAVGLITYCALLLAFIFYTLRRIKHAIRLDKHRRALFYSSLIAGVVALTVSNFFGFSTVMVAILLFIYFALSEIFEAPLLPATTTSHQLTSWQYTAVVIIGVLSLIGVYKTYAYWTADMSYTRGKALLEQGELELGLEELSVAINKNKEEALFYDTLADQYAVYALHFANAGQATQAAELTRRSLEASDVVLDLNPRQINYYKTRARILINLSQLDPRLLPQARIILQQALILAPTDAKLMYNLGLIEFWTGNSEEGIARLQETIALKPNYESARWQLAQEYERQGKNQEAITELTYILQSINPNNQLAADKLASLSAQKK